MGTYTRCAHADLSRSIHPSIHRSIDLLADHQIFSLPVFNLQHNYSLSRLSLKQKGKPILFVYSFVGQSAHFSVKVSVLLGMVVGVMS